MTSAPNSSRDADEFVPEVAPEDLSSAGTALPPQEAVQEAAPEEVEVSEEPAPRARRRRGRAVAPAGPPRPASDPSSGDQDA